MDMMTRGTREKNPTRELKKMSAMLPGPAETTDRKKKKLQR